MSGEAQATLDAPTIPPDPTPEPVATPAPVAAEPAAPTFDPASVPPELKASYEAMHKHFEAEKAKALEEVKGSYADAVKKAEALDQMTRDERYQAWAKSGFQVPKTEAAPKKGLFEDMPDDEYSALLNDKKRFGSLLEQLVEERAAARLEPRVEAVAKEQETLRIAGELERFASVHKDFWEPKVNKAFNEVISRNPGMTIEDAYFLAKRPLLEQEAKEKALQAAHQVVDGKRQASLEKPGVSSARSTGAPIKASSFEEAARMALKGTPVDEIEY